MSKNISNNKVSSINSNKKSFTIEVHQTENAFLILSSEWSKLVKLMNTPHPFYEPEWQFSWWREFG